MPPPHLPAPEPRVSFLEQELAGFPVWIHLVAAVATCGIYLFFLPVVILIDAAEKSAGWVVGRALEMALRVLSVPARILYRVLLLLSQRMREAHRRRTGSPGATDV